jgi:hypothetical protein
MERDAMTDIGVQLAQARERRGLSLADVSARTKLSIPVLQAIDEGAMNKLPGGIYTRGFLRAYAQEVGCDPEEIVRRYRAAFEPWEGSVGETENGPAVTLARNCDERVHVAEIDAIDRHRSIVRWLSAAAVIVLGTLYVGFVRPDRSGPSLRDPSNTPATRPAAAAELPAPSAVATSGALSSDPGRGRTADATGRELRLEIQPDGLCWMSATADGQPVLSRLMNVGEFAHVQADQEVVLRVGDAATCRMNINGAATRRLGTSGQALTLHITPANFREFLDR